jgi:hypothetical protein
MFNRDFIYFQINYWYFSFITAFFAAFGTPVSHRSNGLHVFACIRLIICFRTADAPHGGPPILFIWRIAAISDCLNSQMVESTCQCPQTCLIHM